jgi:murein DD-endopeptidase MepM/ murein hydrolase activator NlpD
MTRSRLPAKPPHGRTVTTAEVEALVRATATALPVGAMEAMPLTYATPAEFGFDALLETPAGTQGVRITPQNVSFVTRTDGGGVSRDERLLAIQPGQPLPDLLMQNGMAEAGARDAIAAMDGLIDLTQLTPNHRVRLAFEPSLGGGIAPRALRVSIYLDGAHQATVARNDAGMFVRADEPPPLPAGIEDALPVVAATQSRTLYEAIYLTALENEVPAALINQLVRIFAFDLDMSSRIGPRDSIEVFHRLPDGDGTEAVDEGIVFAAVTLAGVTKRYYRFQNPADGTVDYFDAEGRSANIFLLRKPMSTGEYRSGFGMRRHPILGTYTMHTGVDWAAPYGTPIVSAGDGVVVSAGWVSGYGYLTRIRHANGYESAYAHQTRFAPNIEAGTVVHQGQVIGYVGSTGLSTGPHLHYEVRINDQLVDPLRIRLPRGDVLEGEILATFQAQRHEIDATLGITDQPSPPTDVAAAPAAN